MTPRGGYEEAIRLHNARSAAMVHAFCYSRLSPISAANVANDPGKPLILLYGGPGRTRTSNQAVMSAVLSLKRPAFYWCFRSPSGPSVHVWSRRFIGHSLVGRNLPGCASWSAPHLVDGVTCSTNRYVIRLDRRGRLNKCSLCVPDKADMLQLICFALCCGNSMSTERAPTPPRFIRCDQRGVRKCQSLV